MPELDRYFEPENIPKGLNWEEDLALLDKETLSPDERDHLEDLQALSQDFAALSEIQVNDNFEGRLAEKLTRENVPVSLKAFKWLPYATVAAAASLAVFFFAPKKPIQVDNTRQYLLQVQLESSSEIASHIMLTPKELQYPEHLIQKQPHLAL